MASKPQKKNSSGFTLPHEAVMRVLNREFTSFFNAMLEPEPNWPRPSDEQFIEAIATSLVSTGNQVREGRGLAMLQTFVYDLQDLINSGVLPPKNAEDTTVANDSTLPAKRAPTPDKSAGPAKPQEIHFWAVDSGPSKTSPLFRMGYNVAETGPSAVERRAILQTALGASQLPGLRAAEDKKRWGSADSAQRLYAISTFLAWLIHFQGSEKLAAEEKWKADLKFLKDQHYDKSMGFEWPRLKTPPAKKRRPDAAFMKPLTLSPALQAVVGKAPLPRTEIVSKLWVYIKKKGLQDKANKQMVNADEKLLAIFGKPQVSMFEMAGLIGKHVK